MNVSMKPLTTEQYEIAREKAIERVKGRIGEKPTREQFRREMATIFTPLDYLAIVVFVAALLISSAHIIAHMGKITATNFVAGYTAGIVLDVTTYTVVHQIGMIMLAEASMLLFMVMHGTGKDQRAGRKGIAKQLSVSLILAIIAGVFVFTANVQSGIGLLESLMPPLFTVGIGFRLETLIVELLTRRTTIDLRYMSAMDTFERASHDPTAHPDFAAFFKQQIWEKLTSLVVNKEWKDAPSGFRSSIVRREMERDSWAYAEHDQRDEAVADWQPERPTRSQNALARSGKQVQGADGDDDTQPIEIDNEPIVSESN